MKQVWDAVTDRVVISLFLAVAVLLAIVSPRKAIYMIDGFLRDDA